MAALTADRNTPQLHGDIKRMGVAAVKIFAGSIVCRDASGYATKGQTALGLRGAGIALEQVDNSAGQAGDKAIEVREGVFRFDNSAAGDAITAADIGKVCYVVDDHTVAKTDGSGTRSPAGIVAGVDGVGVHVQFAEELLAAITSLNKVYVQALVTTLVGAGVYRAVAPVAGRVTKIWSITEGALTVGDATLTAKIGATAITGGVITIAQASSAAGDIDSAAPTANNAVAPGDGLSVTVGGSNETASRAVVIFEITR
jgi:hypothetical protein